MLSKCKSLCLLHSKAKQYQNVSLEQRKVYYRALQRDRWLNSYKPQPPRKLSAKPFSWEGEGEARLAVTNFLVTDPWPWRSGHGQVMLSLQASTKQVVSQFWQERARFSDTAVTLWGPGPGEEEADLNWQLSRGQVPRQPSYHRWGGQAPRRPSWPSRPSARLDSRDQVSQIASHADCHGD